jgi:hypothetical protein
LNHEEAKETKETKNFYSPRFLRFLRFFVVHFFPNLARFDIGKIQMRIVTLAFYLVASCTTLHTNAVAQIQIGTVTGLVTDPAGARIAGAKISLTNPVSNYKETQISDARGEISFNNVSFGAQRCSA